MSKDKKKEVETKEEKKVTKPTKKKKMTTAQRNRIIMQIAAWLMAIIMILGVIAGLLVYLI